MFGFPDNRLLLADGAEVVSEFGGVVEQFLACIALVASGILGEALGIGTSSNDEPICKEEIAMFTVALSHFLLFDKTILLYFQEQTLNDFGMPGGTGPSKVVETDVEPIIDLLVELMVLVTDLLRGFLLLQSFHLSRSPVFVSTTDVEYIGPLELHEARVHIS